MPKVSAPRKRSSTATANAAARRRLAQAAALPDSEPEPDAVSNWAEAPLDDDMPFESEAESEFESEDAEPDVEPEPEPAPVRPRRITTRRPAGIRTPAAAAPPAPLRARTEPVPPAPAPRAPATRAPAARIQTSSGQPNGSAGTGRGPAHDAARRAPTARVTAPRASAPPPPPAPPEPPASRRILGRRPSATPPFQPSLDEPAEPLVTYELEDDARELFGIDDDDEGWAPPAWVSEAAAKRQSPGRGRPPR